MALTVYKSMKYLGLNLTLPGFEDPQPHDWLTKRSTYHISGRCPTSWSKIISNKRQSNARGLQRYSSKRTFHKGCRLLQVASGPFLRSCPPFNARLTSRNRALLEKLTSSLLVKKFPVFYGTCRFIKAFTRIHYLSLS